MEEEIWKDIPNYEGCYQVSNLGRVKSLDIIKRRNKYDAYSLQKGIIRKLHINKNTGYYMVGLSRNGVSNTRAVHQLMASAFFNVSTNKLIVVDHINSIRTDNRLLNLRIVSQRDNSRKRVSKKEPASNYIGVYKNTYTDKWRSRIYISGDRVSIGQYFTEHEANKVYNIALNNMHLYNGDGKNFREQINKLYNE